MKTDDTFIKFVPFMFIIVAFSMWLMAMVENNFKASLREPEEVEVEMSLVCSVEIDEDENITLFCDQPVKETKVEKS